jgi:hypothetical protein
VAVAVADDMPVVTTAAGHPAEAIDGKPGAFRHLEPVYMITAAVNARGWEKLPIADRDTKFAFRAATDRLAAKASTIDQFSGWFFWRNPAKPANNRNSYRMPFADVFEDGTVKLVPAAVFSAAAQLAGAHGLVSIPPDEREQIMRTIDRIYDKFRTMWDDPRQVPPWERPSNSVADEPVKAAVGEEDNMPITLIEDDDELTAAAAPTRAPSTWYENPMLAGPTKVRVTDEGRVYGHLAQWNTCHRGIGNSCLLAPRSIVDYAHFKTGTTMTADGMLRPVGNLTYGAGHADTSLGYLAAAAHYDDAATTVANVNVGEDAYGIWVAGSMAPGTGELEAQQLRSHPLSGDWRRTGGNLELIAALAVNTPGFPIEEPQYSVTASGDQMSLIAAGVVLEDGVVTVETVETVTADATSEEEMARRAERIEKLKANADALRARDWQRRSRRIIDIQLPDRG